MINRPTELCLLFSPANEEAGGEPLKGSIGWAIETYNFGSLKTLVKKMNADQGAALQGGRSHFLFLGLCWSPYVPANQAQNCNFYLFILSLHLCLQWLAVDKELKRLLVETTANQ
ncbi:hypothetical protein MTR67_027337, partial [Solanum verrucosum]